MSASNPTIRFGAIVRQRREELGASQGQIAKAVGISSPEFIGMMEAGSRPVPLDRVPALADALQLDRSDLCKAALAERHPTFYRALFESKD
jgi:transcriptional regulator with XRE-family HTH domain